MFHRARALLASVCAILCLSAAPAHALPACEVGPAAPAAANAGQLTTLAWSPFGRVETGWAIYFPRVAFEVGSQCQAATPGFAAALQHWQRAHGLPETGILDALTFAAMKLRWQGARPFVHASRDCPDPPPAQALATAASRESYGGKFVQLRAAALAAYRAMVADARAADTEIRHDRRAFQIFSGFRDPAYDAARCAMQGNCTGITRATCSAHRTGLAMDMWVGQAPGFGPDSTADPNRLAMVATPAYRWLLANAARYGFVNYAFEPWHWEWTGEPVQPRAHSPG